MNTYDRKVAALEAHARFLEGQMAQLVREGEALVSLHSALKIALPPGRARVSTTSRTTSRAKTSGAPTNFCSCSFLRIVH